MKKYRPTQIGNTRRIKYIPLQGGEDQVTPLYSRKPGVLNVSRNFECDSGGRYRRVAGYERFDGHTSPSDATYYTINFDAGVAEITEGDTVTGATSGATGVALIDGVLESGTYAESDAAGYLVLTEVSGTFQDNENLQVAAATTCVADGAATIRGASTTTLDTTYIRDAIATARTNISAVTGSGNILGGFILNGACYAFRNNAGGTASILWKESTSGWAEVNLGDWIDFDAGTTAFTIDDTLTGGASGATATIKKVVVTSGTWAGADAAGYIILSGVSGSFQDNETITDGAGGAATSASVDSAIALSPSGRYECVKHNFYGDAASICMYGCDGVNYAFQFDGTTYVPIKTGMATDTPCHIAVHKQHLFLSFTGGSVQHSSTGEPLEWSAITGAAEIGIGDEVTGMIVMPGDTMAIFGRNKIDVLYGTGASDWELKQFSREAGAIERSVKKLGPTIFMDDIGLSTLGAVQEYGDFKSNAISQIMGDIIINKKSLVSASLRVKTKEQYRIYFSDGTGINITFNGNKVMGITRLYYDDTVCCTWEGEDSNGDEILFFGSDDGMVHQLEKGTSFDGGAIDALFKTTLYHLGSPQNKKRFFKVVIERDDLEEEGEWGVGTWDDFKWGEQGADVSTSYIDKVDTGYDYLYYSSSAFLEPFVMQGLIIHYSIGGLER